MGSRHGQQTIQGACVSETAVHDHGRRLDQREFRPMAEVPFRPVRQLGEYKGKGASASREPANGPAMEKRTMFALTHSANFNRRGILIISRASFSRGLFMSQDPRGRSFHCPFQLYGKKNRKKKTLSARTRRKVTYLIL